MSFHRRNHRPIITKPFRRGVFHDQARRGQLSRHLSEEPGQKIGSDIVMIASRMGQKAFQQSLQRFAGKTGFPVNISLLFLRISPRKSWKPNAAPSSRSMRPTSPSCSTIRCARASSPGVARRAADQRKGGQGRLPRSWFPEKPEELLKFIGKNPTITGWRSSMATPVSQVWVNKDDLTERIWAASPLSIRP